MIKIILLVLALAVAAILIYAATKPDTLSIQRATSIKAPPEKIFAFINDFHSWAAWSPYEKLDPAMKRTYSGASSGPGAVYEWDGNSKAGQGRMEIMQTAVPSKITIKLDFFKPMEGHNTAQFTMQPNGGATDVTWAMHGPNKYMSKLAGVFINIDRLVGKDFETGLANLKSVAEK